MNGVDISRAGEAGALEGGDAAGRRPLVARSGLGLSRAAATAARQATAAPPDGRSRRRARGLRPRPPPCGPRWARAAGGRCPSRVRGRTPGRPSRGRGRSPSLVRRPPARVGPARRERQEPGVQAQDRPRRHAVAGDGPRADERQRICQERGSDPSRCVTAHGPPLATAVSEQREGEQHPGSAPPGPGHPCWDARQRDAVPSATHLQGMCAGTRSSAQTR